MNEEQIVNIKQRLVGAIVLVSLGVILIPLLLNGGPQLKQIISGNNIPPVPDRLERKRPVIPQPDTIPEPKTIISRPVEDMVKQPEKVQSPTSSSKKVTHQKIIKNDLKKAPRPSSKEINMAYTLQIASFSQKSNATSLRDKLRKSHYKAYIESINTAKGKIYRLRVGPYLKYDQLSGIKKKVEKQFKLSNTIIVKYKT